MSHWWVTLRSVRFFVGSFWNTLISLVIQWIWQPRYWFACRLWHSEVQWSKNKSNERNQFSFTDYSAPKVTGGWDLSLQSLVEGRIHPGQLAILSQHHHKDSEFGVSCRWAVWGSRSTQRESKRWTCQLPTETPQPRNPRKLRASAWNYYSIWQINLGGYWPHGG